MTFNALRGVDAASQPASGSLTVDLVNKCGTWLTYCLACGVPFIMECFSVQPTAYHGENKMAV